MIKKKNIKDDSVIVPVSEDPTVRLSSASSSWDLLDSCSGDFSYGGDSIRGVRGRIYQEESENILRVDIRAYTDNINDFMEENQPYHVKTYVRSVETDISFDKGHCDGTHPTESQDGSSVLWESIFSDVLGHYGLPTSVLSYIFNESRGGIYVDEDMYNPSIRVRGSTTGSLDADPNYVNTFYGVNPNTSDVAQGDYTVEVVYRVTASYPSVGFTSYYKTVNTSDSFVASW